MRENPAQRDDQPCECGTGLSAASCCDFDSASPRPLADEALLARIPEAQDAWCAGDRATSEKLALLVLERAPHEPRALRLLAEIRHVDGKGRAAAKLLKRLIDLEPHNYWAINKLTLLLMSQSRFSEAEKYARLAIRIAPENRQSHYLMGLAATQANRPAVGEYHYRRALELAGARIPAALANLALNLKQQGRMEESRALYAESNAAAPGVRQTVLGWAQMEEADRKFDAAVTLLDELEKFSPNDHAAKLVRAAIFRRQKNYDAALALLQPAEVSSPLRPAQILERGRLLDEMGRHHEAWADFMAGKARAREMGGQEYDAQKMRNFASNLKKFYVRERTTLLPRATTRKDVPQPIFILGFPRSGTTLLEQTLTASALIAAGDELTLINEIAAVMPRLLNSPWEYPGALTELWMADQREGLQTLRDYYLSKVRQMGIAADGALWFTDKMPLNEMHLGLIGLLFPNSPLIHVIRHPLDIMVSAMSNIFSHGGFCGATLETAAEHLALSADLVAHYRLQMDLRYLEVRYEDIVDDQETAIRKVFEFIGVPFDRAVLKFESNSRYARTASYAQVTEKLYTSSRYRYRNYRRYLEPAVAILQPLIERLGYTVEDATAPA